MPHRIQWSWTAFLLGPLWYAIHGLWVQSMIMIAILFMSGFILVLPIAVYCGIRFEEDHQEAKDKK